MTFCYNLPGLSLFAIADDPLLFVIVMYTESYMCLHFIKIPFLIQLFLWPSFHKCNLCKPAEMCAHHCICMCTALLLEHLNVKAHTIDSAS